MEIIRVNAFEQKNKKPRLKFNPGLVLIGFRTTGPWGSTVPSGTKRVHIVIEWMAKFWSSIIYYPSSSLAIQMKASV